METPGTTDNVERNLEAELDEMLDRQVGTSVVTIVLGMASDLTLGDLKDLAASEPGAAGLTLSDVFAEYIKANNLVCSVK